MVSSYLGVFLKSVFSARVVHSCADILLVWAGAIVPSARANAIVATVLFISVKFLTFEIDVMVYAAAGIERHTAAGACSREIFFSGEGRAAHPAEYRMRLRAVRCLEGVVFHLVVAFVAGIIFPAASAFQGRHIARFVIVTAASCLVYVQSIYLHGEKISLFLAIIPIFEAKQP